MSTKIVVLAGLASVVVIAAAWKVLGGTPKRSRGAGSTVEVQTESAVAPESDSRALRERMDLLQAQVTGLRQQLAERGQGAPPSPVSSAAAPDPAAENKRLHEHMRQVEADFEAEARDARWARDTTSEFQAAVARGELLGRAFQSIDCRSTTCRVEMLDDRSPSFHKQLSELARQMVPNLPSMIGERVTRADGTAVAVYYWSKGS